MTFKKFIKQLNSHKISLLEFNFYFIIGIIFIILILPITYSSPITVLITTIILGILCNLIKIK